MPLQKILKHIHRPLILPRVPQSHSLIEPRIGRQRLVRIFFRQLRERPGRFLRMLGIQLQPRQQIRRWGRQLRRWIGGQQFLKRVGRLDAIIAAIGNLPDFKLSPK